MEDAKLVCMSLCYFVMIRTLIYIFDGPVYVVYSLRVCVCIEPNWFAGETP